MQSNTASTTVERVDTPDAPSKHPDPVGTIGAVVLLTLFVLWLSADFARERAWFAERKKRLDMFRAEAARRHAEVREAQMREALFNEGMTSRTRPVAKKIALKTPVDVAPKQRKIFKLYG